MSRWQCTTAHDVSLWFFELGYLHETPAQYQIEQIHLYKYRQSIYF